MPYLKKAKAYDRRPRKRKPTGDQKFLHSKRWQSARQVHLKYEPICKVHEAAGVLIDCTQGEPVDHIIPRSQGGATLDFRNLMTLCTECHDRKSGLEQHRQLVSPAPGTVEGEYYPTKAGKKRLIQYLAERI